MGYRDFLGACGEVLTERLDGGLRVAQLSLDVFEFGFGSACPFFPVDAGRFQIANANRERFRLAFAFAGPFFPPVATSDQFGDQNPSGSEKGLG